MTKYQAFKGARGDAFKPDSDIDNPLAPLKCRYCSNTFTGRDRRHAEELRRNHEDRKHLSHPALT